MPTNPISATDPTAAATSGTAPSGAAAGLLGKDDFLKLLIGQMQHQDPLQPADSSEYMGQLTQFSILEQVTNLSQSASAAASNDYDAQAIALIGKTVTYAKRDHSTVSGVVERVTFAPGGPTLTIDGVDGIAPVTVTEVGA